MRVELILEAIDKASGPLNRVQQTVDKINATKPPPLPTAPARQPSMPPPAPPAALTQQQKLEAAASKRDQARGGLFDAIGTAAAVAAPITKAVQQFNAYEDALTDVGLKSDLSGAKLTALGERIRGQSRALNTSSIELLGGMNKLMEGGLDASAAEKALGHVAKAAIATKTPVDDLGQLTVAMINNGKIGADEVGKGLSALATAGKLGNAELNKMVPYLPRLTSQFATLGSTGVPAVADIGAAFQVVNGVVNNMEGSAAGIRDMMSKITADKAEKAFKAAGIDINKVMKEATAAGRPLDAILETMQKFTGGDLTKINDIFGDVQAQQAVRALLQNLEKLQEFREKARNAGDVIGQDFLTRMGLGVEKTKAFTTAMSELGVTVGQALAPMVGAKMEALTKIVWQLEAWAKANPELISTIAQVATAVAGLLVVLAVAKFTFGLLAWGVRAVLGPLRILGVVFRLLLSPVRFLIGLFWGMGSAMAAAAGAAGGWGVLLAALGRGLLTLLVSPLRLAAMAVMALGPAFAALGAAIMATPVGWIIAAVAAIAAAAYLIYRNWGAIGPFLARVWQSIVDGLASAWASVSAGAARLGQALLNGLQSGWAAVTGWFAGLSWPTLPSFTAIIGDVFAPIVDGLKRGWQAITGWFAGLTWPTLPDFPNPLAAIQAAFDPVIRWIEDWGGRLGGALANAFGKINDFLDGPAKKITSAIGTVTNGLSMISDKLFGPDKSAAGAQATAEQAVAAKTALDAIGPAAAAAQGQASAALTVVQSIPPAAQAAVQAASATLASANFHSHGVAMMATLAQGIRAGAAQAVAAAQETVQKIRNLLPHSPAKEGPLSDLHRVKFGQTLAGAIQLGAPSAIAAAATLAAGLAAAVPSAVAGPAVQPTMASPASGGGSAEGGGGGGGGGGDAGGPITVNLTLSPNFAGGGGGEAFVEQLREALPNVAHELAEAIRGEMDRRDRTKH